MADTVQVQTRSLRSGLASGIAQAAPIVLGFVPIGFAFGVLARKAGLSSLHTLLMSLLVYAGSSQFIAVGLLAAGAPPLSIIVTTFIVNLRHMLMAAALSPYLRRWRLYELAAFGYELTDETFAVHSLRFASGVVDKTEALATNVTVQASWLLGTWLGVVTGQFISDVKPLGLDYALPAMFVVLLILQIKSRLQVGVALLAGATAVLLSALGWQQWSVIAATLLAATAGVVGERWTQTGSR